MFFAKILYFSSNILFLEKMLTFKNNCENNPFPKINPGTPISINLFGFVNGERCTRQGTRILKRVTSEYSIKIPLKILPICFNMLCSCKRLPKYDTVPYCILVLE